MFDGLLQHIIDLNPYFQNGFEDVYQDETTGIVHGTEPVFPADNLGNYFYLRLPDNIEFDYGAAYNHEEGANKPAKSYNLILVACVIDADAEKLLNNLIYTLSTFRHNVTIRTAVINGETVILQELSNMSKENRDAALQRKPKDLTIVSLSFSFVEQTLINCILPVCKTC